MKSIIRIATIIASSCTSYTLCNAQSDLLDNAQHFSVDIPVNDVVYDPIRDVLYASVPSTAGAPHSDSIATIDPVTGDVLDSIFVGSEPNTLAISQDASRVYVGIDGARSMRWWQPADGTLGEMQELPTRFGDPAVAHDFAVPPGRPNVAVVSVDEVGSTANGDLAVLVNDNLMSINSGFQDPNYIGFADSTTMFGFDDSNTGFRASLWELDGQTLTSIDDQGSVVSRFDIESEVGSDGLAYFTDGTVLDATTLAPVGTFTTGLSEGQVLVEPVPALQLTYFIGPTSTFGTTTLKVFDSQSFLEVDAANLTVDARSAQDRGELIIAGANRLAFVWKPQTFDGPGGSGTLNIVSGIPVEVSPVIPEPSTLVFVAVAALIGLALQRGKNTT